MAAWQDLNVDQRINLVKFLQHGSITPEQTTAIIKEWATQNFGALAAYLEIPEVGALISSAAQQGWTAERLQVALGQTQWWQTTTASQREFDALTHTDPASAQKHVEDMAGQIRALVDQEGVANQFTDQRINDLARQLVRNGASADQVPKAVLAEVSYQPSQPVGKMGARMTQVQQMASDYLVPVSDQTAFTWAQKIETGQATEDGLSEYLRSTAEGLLPHLADRLKAGFTVKQLLEPQIQTAAQLLEVSPDQIDLRDPKYAPILSFYDGQTTREKTMAETADYIRSTADWRQTNNANATAAQRVEQIAQRLGAA